MFGRGRKEYMKRGMKTKQAATKEIDTEIVG
jgi:hypothetical protein